MVILTNGLLMVGLFEHIPKKKRGKLYGKPMVSRFPTKKTWIRLVADFSATDGNSGFKHPIFGCALW
jgi:hypothetical protein